MQIPYELALGWRYTRAGRATRRNGCISFISGVSMLGIALGVAALIIVLSVMNGFQKEVRDRMLSVVSHIEIFAPGGAALPDVAQTLAEARRNPAVVGATLGSASLFLSLIPLIGLASLLLAPIGLLSSGVGLLLGLSRRVGRVGAVWGLMTSGLALVVCFGWVSLLLAL